VGQPIIVDSLEPEIPAQIDGPHFSGMDIKSNSSGSIRFAGTNLAGVYNLDVPTQSNRVFAVNLFDKLESNIEPLREIKFASHQVETQQHDVKRANLPLWPFLVGLALFLACLEWLIYNRKMRI